MDLISRQAAIDAINSYFGFSIEEEYGSAVQEVINGLPSAQPERKTGRWEWDEESGSFLCSECNSGYRDQPTLMGKPLFEYCPMCGSKMGGGDE